jgi:hypothetical protein
MSSSLLDSCVLLGVQEARIQSFPRYASSAGDEAIGLARLAGIELDPWQQTELRHEMGESADWKCPRCTWRVSEPESCPAHPSEVLIHPWAAFECCDVVPRQNGKSEKLVARQLAGLFVLEEMLQIYSAHLFDTAMEIFRRLVFVIENCEELRREVKHRGSKMTGIKYSHGEEGIELRDGRRIRFKARTGSGGRGFSADTLYLDEAMILPEAFLGATIPTLSARSNPQVWLAGSAPDRDDPTHDGVVLARRRARALAGGDGSLAYFEHSAEGEDPATVADEVLDDPEQRALANPGLGIRITGEYVDRERAAMGRRQFAVERMGIGAWPDISAHATRVISPVVWRELAERDQANGIVSEPVFAIDCNVEQTWASVAVAGGRADGLWQVAIAAHARGTGWVARVLQDELLVGDAQHALVIADPRGPASHLIPDIRRVAFEVLETSTQDYASACSDFLAGAERREFRYPDPQPDLDAALSGARKQPLGDRWKWSRRSSTSPDISPLVAASLALWGARCGREYATVLARDAGDAGDAGAAMVDSGVPRVLSQADTTSCFACRVGGCTIHTS